MSGSLPVATLLSPQKDYILLYEVTNDKQLVMSRCSLTDPAKGHVRYDPNNQVGAGPVVMPCRISATFQFGMVSGNDGYSYFGLLLTEYSPLFSG